MNQVLESRPHAAAKAVISPARLAHVVLRSSRFDDLVAWYTTVLGAKTAFSDGNLAFLSYDEEHHRIAVLNIPGLQRQPDGIDPFEIDLHHLKFPARNESLHGVGVPDPWPDPFTVPENERMTGSAKDLRQQRQGPTAAAG